MNFTCLYRASSTVPPSCLFCLPLASILPLLPALSSRSRVYSAAAALSPRKLLRCRRAFALLLQDVPSPCRFRLQAGAVCSSPRTTPQPHSRPYIPRSESWSLRRRPWPAGRLQLRYRLPAPPSRTDVWAATRASRSAAEYTDALSKASGAHLSSRAGCKIAVVRRLLRPETSDLPSRALRPATPGLARTAPLEKAADLPRPILYAVAVRQHAAPRRLWRLCIRDKLRAAAGASGFLSGVESGWMLLSTI